MIEVSQHIYKRVEDNNPEILKNFKVVPVDKLVTTDHVKISLWNGNTLKISNTLPTKSGSPSTRKSQIISLHVLHLEGYILTDTKDIVIRGTSGKEDTIYLHLSEDSEDKKLLVEILNALDHILEMR